MRFIASVLLFDPVVSGGVARFSGALHPAKAAKYRYLGRRGFWSRLVKLGKLEIDSGMIRLHKRQAKISAIPACRRNSSLQEL
jgi:hypothetical protein